MRRTVGESEAPATPATIARVVITPSMAPRIRSGRYLPMVPCSVLAGVGGRLWRDMAYPSRGNQGEIATWSGHRNDGTLQGIARASRLKPGCHCQQGIVRDGSGKRERPAVC